MPWVALHLHSRQDLVTVRFVFYQNQGIVRFSEVPIGGTFGCHCERCLALV
jgi:hypothetical protein